MDPKQYAPFSEKEKVVLAEFERELAKLVVDPSDFCFLERVDYQRTGYKLCVSSNLNIYSHAESELVWKYEERLNKAGQ
jgi:hypothetical protein